MEFPEPGDRLDSWKEIAAFLGRTARTVQRWEKTAGLPVHRAGPGTRSGVVASKREVAEWWDRQRHTLAIEDEGDHTEVEAEPPVSLPQRRPIGRILVIAAVVVIALTSAMLLMDRADSAPITSRTGRIFPLSTTEGAAFKYIDLPSTPGGLALSPDGRSLFVGLPEERAVAVVDIATGQIRDRLPGLAGTGGFEVTRDGRLLVMSGTSEVGLIDIARKSLRTVAMGRTVWDVRVSADGRRAWVALAQGGLKVIDTTSLEMTTVPTVGCPVYLAYGSATSRMFVSYQCGGVTGKSGHDPIEVFDEPSRRSLFLKTGPPFVGSRLALSPDEEYLWADTHDACSSSDYDHVGCPAGSGAVLVAFRSDSLEPVAIHRYPVVHSGAVLGFFPDGSRLLASGGGGVHVINAALGHIEEGMDLGQSGEVEFTADGRRVFVAQPDRKRLLDLPLGPVEDPRSLADIATYWPGDGSASDLAGGTHALAPQSVSYAPGRVGLAFSFATQDAGVSFGKRLDSHITDEPSTYAAWVRPRTEHATSAILSRASFIGWSLSLIQGKPAFCFARAPAPLPCESGGLIATTSLAAGAWHHVAVVRSASDVALFVNGDRVAAASLSAYVPPPGRDYDEEPVMRLGAGRDGRAGFDGLIDELTMFRRALGPPELKRLMQLTSAKN